jgi:hypothetical protein
MKHNKAQIEEVVLKLLSDINQYYLKEEGIKIRFENNEKILDSNEIIANAWIAVVIVNHEQWDWLTTPIIIILDDDTLEIKSYTDNSCGRPDIYKGIKKIDGKYDLEVIKK